MKVLAVSAPGAGMYLSTVPTLWALVVAGHDVLCVNNGASAEALSRAGLITMDAAPDRDVFAEFLEVSSRIHATSPGEPPPRGGLGMFGELMLEGTLAIAERFRPDLVLTVQEQGAGPVVAAALGVPCVEHGVRLGWVGEDETALLHRHAIEEYMSARRRALGVPDPVAPARVLDPRPPSMGGRAVCPHQSVRFTPHNHGALLRAHLPGTHERPLVLLTMGTVLSSSAEAPRLAALVASLASMPIDVLLALGDRDMTPLGRLPDNVHSLGWVPLASALGRCSAIVHHGGSGTTMSALSLGVPQVLLPFYADQPANAACVEQRGVGLCLDGPSATTQGVRERLTAVLRDADVNRACDEVARENRGLPGPVSVTERLTELV